MNSFRCLLMTRKADGNWVQSDAICESPRDIRTLFRNNVTQVDLSKYAKLYYNATEMSDRGVGAMVKDQDGDRVFLTDRFLIVECNDREPIDLSDILQKKVISSITMY